MAVAIILNVLSRRGLGKKIVNKGVEGRNRISRFGFLFWWGLIGIKKSLRPKRGQRPMWDRVKDGERQRWRRGIVRWSISKPGLIIRTRRYVGRPRTFTKIIEEYDRCVLCCSRGTYELQLLKCVWEVERPLVAVHLHSNALIMYSGMYEYDDVPNFQRSHFPAKTSCMLRISEASFISGSSLLPLQ